MVAPRLIFLFTGFLALFRPCFSQISGTVRDAGGAPLPGVSLFINRSRIMATTDASGAFALTGVPPGFAEVIAYKKGFQVFRSPVRVQEGHAIRVPLKLISAKEVVVAHPIQNIKERTRYLEDIRKLAAAGPDQNICKILNESDLTFYKTNDSLKVKADGPIILVNPASGFRITYYPDIAAEDATRFFASMMFRFEPMEATYNGQPKDWDANREQKFLGSARHLFSALTQKQGRQQGFTLISESGDTIHQDSLIRVAKVMGYSVVNLKGRTKIIFDPLGNEGLRTSSMYAADNFAVNEQGILLNEKSVTFEGGMRVEGLAGRLPIDYYPADAVQRRSEIAVAMKLLEERTYVQTDKPYYYPGEPVWLKGYVNYRAENIGDSLSRVLYVEIISPGKKSGISKMFRIDSGMVSGDFILPDTLKSGNYYLRAYTNFMMNFSPANVFTSVLPILNPTDKVDPSQAYENSPASHDVSWTTDKPSYHARDKITLTFAVRETPQNAGYSNFSVSVTDAVQVVPVRPLRVITENFPFQENAPDMAPHSLHYPIERTFSVSGQFKNNKGKNEPAKIIIMEGDFENMIRMNSPDGVFRQPGYSFYDSLSLSILGQADSGKPGTITLLPHEIAPFSGPDVAPLKIIPTQVQQRIITGYDVPRGVTVLKEVSVSSRKITGSQAIVKKYGVPHRIIDGKRFNGTDMVNSLTFAIPSLKILSVNDGMMQVRYLSFTHQNQTRIIASAAPPIEPLIYVNDVWLGGGPMNTGRTASSVLQNIDPTTIDHVEVFYANPPNTQITVDGGSGLIAIYTRPDKLNLALFKKFIVKGFYRPRPFRAPAYAQSSSGGGGDFRSTIYWNPSVKITEANPTASVSFYAADLPGKYHVVAEGVTNGGKPLRAEFYFEVKE